MDEKSSPSDPRALNAAGGADQQQAFGAYAGRPVETPEQLEVAMARAEVLMSQAQEDAPPVDTGLFPYFYTLLAAGIGFVAFSVNHAGFMLLYFLPVIGLYAGYSLLRAYSNITSKEERFGRLARVVTWGVALLMAAGMQVKNAHVARVEAQEMVRAVEDFRNRSGRWPRDMEEAGLGDTLDRMSQAQYTVVQGQPAVVYHNTWTRSGVYWYSFAQRAWN